MGSQHNVGIALGLAVPLLLSSNLAAAAESYNPWTLATAVPINTPVNDGCPIESPDGLSLFIASNRPGTAGGNDIWVSTRANKKAAWGEPQNVGSPVNTPANDFCPTPLADGWLFFVSEKVTDETCATGPGIGDMYLTRKGRFGYSTPTHLGCAETGDGPNTFGIEYSPSFIETDGGSFLFYSSNAQGTQDIYMSRMRDDGSFEPGVRIDVLSTAGFDDRMPNVSRDGLEIVFSSNRNDLGGFGGQDVYVSTRACVDDPWSAPVNLGPNVNTAGNETRSTLSGDKVRLYFGRDGDVYTASRTKARR